MSEREWNFRPAALPDASPPRGERRRRWPAVLPVAAMAAILAGCVSVKAPDKPIVIELNINIKQEVVYRLAEDASNTIEKNPEIF